MADFQAGYLACPIRQVISRFGDKWSMLVLYPEVPPRVEYSLTETGRSLMPAITSLIDWANQHFDDVVT
ncbi:MAG: helix-turn-helix transcriptional regulator [Prevotella sp.]|nr:helix-turn-helix transcriptional regulator [Prevotella sp.]